MSAATALMTFEEFELLPDEPGKLELLEGELAHMPPPKIRHTKAVMKLTWVLKPVVDASPQLGELLVEAGYRLGKNSWLVPDLSIQHPGQLEGDYSEGAPLLAVEVISELNTAESMDRKVKMYLANGGEEVWVIYPKTLTAMVFRKDFAERFDGEIRSRILGDLVIGLDEIIGR